MKAWIKTRRSVSSASGFSKHRNTSRPANIDNDQHNHSWVGFADNASSKAPETPTKRATPELEDTSKDDSQLLGGELSYTDTDTVGQNTDDELYTDSPEATLLQKHSHMLSSSRNDLLQKKILVTSERYFQVVYEAYEQLKAVHYKASLGFSWAEWLHIHALLFYGRIQAIQKESSTHTSYGKDNEIKIKDDLPIFTPIAMALNAIGTVEDTELGFLYVPQAYFPRQKRDYKDGGDLASSKATEEFALDIQNILKGTLYDWERSWNHVLEARQEREFRNMKTQMPKTTSQLLEDIKRTTNALKRARRAKNAVNSTSKSSDFELEPLANGKSDKEAGLDASQLEAELIKLLKEARDSKDYNTNPPSDASYSESTASLKPIDESIKSESTARLSSITANRESFTGKDSSGLFSSLSSDESERNIEKLPKTLMDIDGDGFDNKSGGFSSTNTKGSVSSSTTTNGSSSKEVSPKATSSRSNSLRDLDSVLRPLSRSVFRKPPPGLRISRAVPFQMIPIPSDVAPTLKLSGSLCSLALTPSIANAGIRSRALGYETSLSVQFDDELWENYLNYVDALQNLQLARFASMKSGAEGTYAWMIPVDVNPVDSYGTARLLLPRRSIPDQDQLLALILQTCAATPDVLHNWQISKVAHINMKQLLSEYVAAAINDRLNVA